MTRVNKSMAVALIIATVAFSNTVVHGATKQLVLPKASVSKTVVENPIYADKVGEIDNFIITDYSQKINHSIYTNIEMGGTVIPVNLDVDQTVDCNIASYVITDIALPYDLIAIGAGYIPALG